MKEKLTGNKDGVDSPRLAMGIGKMKERYERDFLKMKETQSLKIMNLGL